MSPLNSSGVVRTCCIIGHRLLKSVAMQDRDSCNMTPSMTADDPNAYMFMMCSSGVVCTCCIAGHRLLKLVAMQDRGSCNMTPSMTADDPNAYMLKMCSQGYYGPLCSLCLLRNAPEGQQPYGRAGPLECKPCRCAFLLSCSAVLLCSMLPAVTFLFFWKGRAFMTQVQRHQEHVMSTQAVFLCAVGDISVIFYKHCSSFLYFYVFIFLCNLYKQIV